MTTVFLEGDYVSYVGDGLDGIPPAQGKIMAFASQASAHVEWTEGPRQGQIDMVSVYELEKSASLATREAGPVEVDHFGMLLSGLTHNAVRKVMSAEGSEGVLKLLASTGQLDSWEEIGRDVLVFVESRLRVDASMDLPFEQLDYTEADDLIRTAAMSLLRDKFGDEVAS